MTGIVFSMVSVLRGRPRGRRGQRKIIGIGGDQHRGKRLAGLAKRRPDQGIAVPVAPSMIE